MHIYRYRSGDAPLLAEHLNASRDAWPEGGIKHGVPSIPESIRAWLDDQDWNLFLLWVGNSIAAVCGYYCSHEKEKRAYIPLVNVHPQYHGQGLGQKIMLYCLEDICTKGYDCVDLHTWSANYKAQALYANLGFFQKSIERISRKSSSIHMINFLPRLLSIPLVGKYVDRNHWQRDFRPAHPSGVVEGDSYTYKWSGQEGPLRARIHVDSEELYFLETPDSVYGLELERSKLVPDEEMWLKFKAQDKRGGAPVPIRCGSHEAFWPRGSHTLGDQEEEKTIVLNPEGEEQSRRDSTFTATFGQGEKSLTLERTLSLLPVVEVHWEDTVHHLKPGERNTVWLDIQNNSQEELEVALRVSHGPHVEHRLSKRKLTLPGQGRESLSLELLSSREGVETVILYMVTEKAALHSSRDVVCRAPGQEFSGIVNDVYTLINDHVSLEGEKGQVTVRDQATGQKVLHMGMVEWGLPYNAVLWKQRPCTMEWEGGTLKMQRTVGDCTITHSISVQGPMIQSTYTVANEGNHTVEGKLLPHNQVESLHFTRVALSTNAGLIQEPYDGYTFPGKRDVSFFPTHSFPLWQAFQYGDRVVAMALSEAGEGWVDVVYHTFMAQNIPCKLKPHSSRTIEGHSIYLGPGNCEDAYTKLCSHRGAERMVELGEPVWEHLPVLRSGHGKGLLKGAYPAWRERSLQLEIGYPRSLSGFKRNHTSTLKEQKGYTVPMQWQGFKGAPGVYPVQLQYCLGGWQRKKELPLLMQSGEEVSVRENEKEWQVENGSLAWKLAPDFAGHLVELRYKGEDLILSPYPEKQPYSWIDNWFGGLGPALFQDADEEYPNQLHRGTMAAAPVERYSQKGLQWQGVGLHWSCTAYPHLSLKIFYLTLPSVPVLAMLLDLGNEGDHSISLDPRFYAFLHSNYMSRGSESILGRRGEEYGFAMGEKQGIMAGIDWITFRGKESLTWVGPRDMMLSLCRLPSSRYLVARKKESVLLRPGEKAGVSWYLFPGAGSSGSLYRKLLAEYGEDFAPLPS